MSRDEQLRSAGLALEERANLRRKRAAIEAEIQRQAEAARLFASFCHHLGQGNDTGWTLDEIATLADGTRLLALVADYRETSRVLAAAERRIKEME
jgi:hypothetical protein